MSRLIQRCVPAALFAACLALPAEARAPLPVTHATKPASTSTAVSHFWQLLRNLWGANGSSLDPDGKPGSSTQTTSIIPLPPATTPNGSSLDPNG
jgi:hypothetical protein